MSDDAHTCEVCELATELADERTLHQATLARERAYREALERVAAFDIPEHGRGSSAWVMRDQARAALAVVAAKETGA